jgi:hypothetical protein
MPTLTLWRHDVPKRLIQRLAQVVGDFGHYDVLLQESTQLSNLQLVCGLCDQVLKDCAHRDDVIAVRAGPHERAWALSSFDKLK